MDYFPKDLPGLGWSITKAPKFATRTQTSISGRELRVPDMPYPRWTWTLTYEFLRDQHDTRFGPALGTGHDELRELMGFYVRQQGAFQTFLYDDPTDNYVVNQGVGIGNGSTTQFQLLRTLSAPTYGGLFTEPVTQPQIITNVYVNGAPVSYSRGNPFAAGNNGIVTLASPPASGTTVSATFTYVWPVHFTEDTADFENFLYQLWQAKKITFESVLLP